MKDKVQDVYFCRGDKELEREKGRGIRVKDTNMLVVSVSWDERGCSGS